MNKTKKTMLGGGFLKQGADSAKYNRSLLGKEEHKPFEKKESRGPSVPFVNHTKMSPELQRELLLESQRLNQADIRKKIIGAIVVFVLLLTALGVML